MDPPPSLIDLGIGRMTLQELMLYQLEDTVQAEVRWQNHLLYLSAVQGNNMREVRDLADGMRNVIADLRKANVDAKAEFHAEVNRATVNTSKVRAFTDDLKAANQEVEAMLGDTASNFPSSEASPTLRQTGHVTDINGVTKSQG